MASRIEPGNFLPTFLWLTSVARALYGSLNTWAGYSVGPVQLLGAGLTLLLVAYQSNSSSALGAGL